MSTSAFNPRILDKLQKLQEKYNAMGQDLESYLDGLLHADYLTYWDYIHLDTLLSLQTPKTDIPDEKIFIGYHQITELNFMLILWELKQVCETEAITRDVFKDKLGRICRYFEYLEHSFDIMTEGMDKEQFLKFRMALLPASGFQSAQYRKIELAATGLHQLITFDQRKFLSEETDYPTLFKEIYWKKGATELSSGEKTLTLKQFELKYEEELVAFALTYQNKTIRDIFHARFEQHKDDALIALLRRFDLLANVFWPLAHYKTAVKYLNKKPEVIAATGGTNWQEYMPPRFQKVIFFPELWSEEEQQEWGKPWVVKEIFND